MVYLVVGEVLMESLVFSQFTHHKGTKSSRALMYQKGFIRSWILAIFFFSIVFYYKLPLTDFGFRPVDLTGIANYSLITKIILILIAVAYFAYFYLFSVILYRFNPSLKEKVIIKLLPFKEILPENKTERCWWMANSFTSFIEEVLYRGFVIFYLTTVFPGTSLLIAAVASVALDALRYVTRPAAVLYVIYSSTVFVLGYVVFDSIYVAILLHIIHDLRVLFMPLDAVYKRIRSQTENSVIS